MTHSNNINALQLFLFQAIEKGEISGIYTRWIGPDITTASSSSDTLVLELGHVIMSFAFIFITFGLSLLVLGMEHLWSLLKAKDIKLATPTWKKDVTETNNDDGLKR